MSEGSGRTLITDDPPRDDSFANAGRYAKDRGVGPDVVKDNAKTEYTGEVAKGGDPNSDAQLALDEKEAIDKSNIMPTRTRAQDPNSDVGTQSYVDPEETDAIVDQDEKGNVLEYEEAGNQGKK